MTSKLILLSLLLPFVASGDIDYVAAELEFQKIVAAQEDNFNNLEGSKAELEKKDLFSLILEDSLGILADQDWNHPLGDWPIIDWEKVNGRGSFFQDQFNWIIKDGVIADTAENLARLQFSGSILSQQTLLGSSWFESWFLDQATASDDNVKKLLFWYSEDFGADLKKTPEKGVRVVDWNLWRQSFDAADELGKAIILKNLTMWASRVDGWKTASDIHLSVFNGNNDALKAIALVKSDKNLGDEVISKWKDMALNSRNIKIKRLAQDVLALYQIEIGKPR